MKKIVNEIKKRTGNSPDLMCRELNIACHKMYVLFFDTLCDTRNINDFLFEYLGYIKFNKKIILDLYEYTKEFMPSHNVKGLNNTDDIISSLYSGFAVAIVENKYYAMEFRRQLDSGIAKSDSEKTIKGPKDAFTETYQTNIGLIRKRVRSEKLWLDEVFVGEKSNTKVGILYVKDIVDLDKVKEIKKKISEIFIDTVPDSNYIYEMISNNKSLFPTVLSTERPDLVSYKLLNGKIAIVVENTPYVLILPAFFIEFFHTMDDYYQNNKSATYMRVIRILSFFITVMLPAIYIALITFNHEIIPPGLLINFASQKEGVPFPTVLEAIVMLATFEVLRETDVRSPSTLGSALSIVGALVLGDAAVQAGLVSPIMVIVIAITAISEMIFSVNDVSTAVKLWRLIFIAFGSVAGIVGVFIALILLMAELCSIDSFGVPYLYPISPFDKDDQGNDIVLTEKYKFKFRNKLTAKKNTIRGDL